MFLAKQEVNWKEENFLYIDQVVLSEIEHRNDKIRKYDVVNDTSVVSGGIPKNIVRTYNTNTFPFPTHITVNLHYRR